MAIPIDANHSIYSPGHKHIHERSRTSVVGSYHVAIISKHRLSLVYISGNYNSLHSYSPIGFLYNVIFILILYYRSTAPLSIYRPFSLKLSLTMYHKSHARHKHTLISLVSGNALYISTTGVMRATYNVNQRSPQNAIP